LFPDSTFYHLIRNPLDEISSWLSKNLFSKEQLHPAYIHEQIYNDYRSMIEKDCDWPLLEQLTWHWKNINLFIDVMLNGNTGIKSENLFSASKNVYLDLTLSCAINDIDFFDYKDHYSTKHNELNKMGQHEHFSRKSFPSNWLQSQDKEFQYLINKYNYVS